VERRLLAALLLAAVAAAAAVALAAALTVTVTYEVWGGLSTSFTPIPYAVEGAVSYTKPAAAGYAALGGVSTAYRPLRYVFNAGLEVEGVSVPAQVRVHVRLLKGGKAYIPDFDIEYMVNGTKRIVKHGEDTINTTLTRLILAVKDPLVLEFPPAADGYSLVNSTPITVDLVPWGAVDVWVYYSGAAQPPPPPPPPPQPPAPPPPPAPEEGRPAPEEAPPRGYVFIPPWLYELLERWWLLALLLALLLLLYLLRRRGEGVTIVIEVPRWAAR